MFYTISNNQIIYNYQKSLDFISQKGKEIYGTGFKLLSEDMPLIRKLFVYMIQDTNLTRQEGLDPRKGIMLCGPIGAGKTSLIHLMRLILPEPRSYMIKSCRDISFEFHKDGYDVIHRYSKKSFEIKPGAKIPKTICFDDLGAEENLKHFGNECNALSEILLSRYDLFISDGLLTHMTTNLNASEIEKQYGARVRSRLREMMNVLSFPDDAADKRK
ncbi:ATPase [Plebeiibacterium sediminum]|uniref:ATPase n=1 Tax=Plebeiibacterium sediminum TaxID=2992112 RepID=A0AAE3M730_9BACT|nr:ATPase [Plebeiobacterium sediminum]MCW3788211.1 ATPase [Plebeiobacterium sediminum]